MSADSTAPGFNQLTWAADGCVMIKHVILWRELREPQPKRMSGFAINLAHPSLAETLHRVYGHVLNRIKIMLI